MDNERSEVASVASKRKKKTTAAYSTKRPSARRAKKGADAGALGAFVEHGSVEAPKRAVRASAAVRKRGSNKGQEVQQTTLYLPATLMRRMKLHCVGQGMTMSDFVAWLVERELETS